jgi:YesN/AraC family two-component response regulator
LKNIICERRIYEDKLNIHSHLYGQLILPIKGSLFIETNYKKIEIDNNKLFFIPPDCEHVFKANKSNEFLTLDISDKMLNRNDMKNMPGGKELELDDRWKAVRYLLLNECKEKNNSNAINDLFNYCYHLILEGSLSKSIEYINNHFMENIDISILADIEHYNISYYSEWFKNKMNMTVTEYIRFLRIKKAKEFLTDSNLSILEIAQMVGYEHNSSFTRVFKAYEKMSPAEFRKKI